MIIDSLGDTEVFVEQKVESTITVNSLKNNNGVLEIDDLENKLVGLIDSGETEYYTMTQYNGTDGVMLYNRVTKEIQVVKVGDSIKVRNDFQSGTQYFIGAKRVLSTSVNNGIFTVPIDGKNIFRVQLSGRDVKSYQVNGNTIKILGNMNFLVDNFSEIVVYLYDKDKIIEGDGTTLTITYQTYQKVWEDDMFDNPQYWISFRGNQLENFDSASISSNVQEDTNKQAFGNVTRRVLNTVDNTISMTTFEGKDLFNIVDSMVGQEFRLLFYNGYYGRVVLVNNCVVSDNVNIVYDKNKNTKTFTIYCGNYIDINKGKDRPYGEGQYGRGRYGGEKIVKNSARLGEVL